MFDVVTDPNADFSAGFATNRWQVKVLKRCATNSFRAYMLDVYDARHPYVCDVADLLLYAVEVYARV